MKEINVHEFTTGLNETFRRYLATTNLIVDSEPNLREEIWNQLGKDDFFARRPLVTAIPAYKPSIAGRNLLGLKSNPSLTESLRKLNSEEFDLNRPLYQHQLTALEKAQNGRNIIVATGTGSGKTECFLLPVLDDAAKHPETGVRTIIVYPMNALANDQIDRLRRLLKDLPEITFGRYTGETPETRQGLTEEDVKRILVNERFSRQEIKDDPPQILLTNFAMLEYLLLRPSDNNIFRHHSLRYVVLDEAHTYSGAQGIDISLLMRRLTQRYENNDLQFILTSATLSEDETDESREKIAEFGKCLTGAIFEFGDVIFGEAIHGFDKKLKPVSADMLFSAVPNEKTLQKWLDTLEDAKALKDLINTTDLPNKEKIQNLNETGAILYELFRDWQPVHQLHEFVSENAYSFDELTKFLWNREDTTAILALKWLLTLAARAKKDPSQPPLISARFHFFFRGLSGASVCLNPQCPCANINDSTVKRIYLESRNLCQSPCESLLLPLSTCFQCGLPAVEVWLDENNRKWKALKPSTMRDQIPTRLFLTWDQSLFEVDESEESETNQQNAEKVELCIKCGSIGLDGNLNSCCTTPIKISLKRINPGKDNNVKNCPRCGADARPFLSVLREFRSGDDAVTAVLAEQMMRHLPEEENSELLPAGGRKMLAFSDSRQRAAFFAPYLKRTTAETEYSNPLYEALLVQEAKNDNEPVTINEVTKRFVKNALERKQIVLREYNEEQENDTYKFISTRNLQKSDEKNLRRQAEITLLKHFCASPRQRTTWSGLGLASAEVELTRGDKEDLLKALPEIFVDNDTAGWDLIQQLLQVFLTKRALYIEDDEISNKDLGKGAREVTFHFNLNDSVSGRQRVRWNPYRAAKIQKRTISNNYQTNVVAKFFSLDVEKDTAQIDNWLERFWNAFRETVFYHFQSGGEYQIDSSRILITTKKPYSFCDSCGRLTIHYAKGYCVMPKCNGRLKNISNEELEEKFSRYHYRHRVLHNKAMALNVVEHTAQLTNKHGQDYQKRFINGEINVLSSSTTFEMGVDVGGLKAVLLRNVPPTASNYIQRAGRAGRRRDGAAYAVTYSRSLPHDQYHYHNPSSVIRGKVPIPLINLKNTRLAKRHVNSFLLGEFLRNLESGTPKNVSDFFLSPSESHSPFQKFNTFLKTNQESLAQTVKFILPDENSLEATECITSSARKLGEIYAEKVKDILDSFKKQYDEISSQKAKADTSQLGKIKFALESIERLISQLQNEPLINFLSSAHWLPSYAFPQDTIRLFVRQSHWTEKMRLERDREQGISEYAPGAEIIADGKLFKSAGVIRPNRGFDVRKCRYCRQCRRLKTANSTENIPPTCDCGSFCQINDYIVPTGFQTLYNEKVEEPNLFRLSPPTNTEISLISGTHEKDFRSHKEILGVSYGYRRDGKLFRANAGYNFDKFRLCRECGRHFTKTSRPDTKGHETPWGTRCLGTLFNTHLAHEFETDILQLRFNLPGKTTPPVNDSEFWLSLTSAFTSAAAEALSIPRNDLDAIYQSQNINESQGELIIYDKVPGGAGYVERIIDNIPIILRRVLERTINCENPLCDGNSSCYTCLRNYQNQFYWDKLMRNKVSKWLGSNIE